MMPHPRNRPDTPGASLGLGSADESPAGGETATTRDTGGRELPVSSPDLSADAAALCSTLALCVVEIIADASAVIGEELGESLVTAGQYSFLGAGWSVGLAHEAALKMREAAQSWTESYPAKEYRHGPIAIAAPGRVTWMFGDAPAGLADDVAATGAHFEHRGIDGMADLVRAQRVALERARRSGLDPDRPRNLTRSVILSS
ncbi:SIS domain-containing protein [Leifsonia xyli]|nr:hypothetical protein [Leifsonia xyli]